MRIMTNILNAPVGRSGWWETTPTTTGASIYDYYRHYAKAFPTRVNRNQRRNKWNTFRSTWTDNIFEKRRVIPSNDG